MPPDLPSAATGHRHDQDVFHTLLERHAEITRSLREIPGGIAAETTAQAPDLVALLHDHAQAMHRRLIAGQALRRWDPAFAELFAQADKVRMQVDLRPDGVAVRETSDDPNVVLLIRAHGAVVSGFVARGFAAAQSESPLPEAYQRVLS